MRIKGLEEESSRLHALWHDAAADAMAQREEAKRLYNLLDKCQAQTTAEAIGEVMLEEED